MQIIKFVILFFLITMFAQAQSLSIELDLSNANKTLEILKNHFPTRASLDELMALESTKALLKKLNASDSTMTQAITKSFRDDTVLSKKEGYFQYKKIQADIDNISGFVIELKINIGEVEKRLQNALQPYIPNDKHASIKVVGIVGGHSTGYTFGDGNTFYISLHHMNNDLDYFFQICKHELFHNMQALWFDNDLIWNNLKESEKTAPGYYTYYMFWALYMEGTATFIDDIKNFKSSEANEAWIERYRKNERREKHIFWLFDKLVVGLQDDFSEEAINKSYGTFFLTKFDELGYYMGAQITRYLLEKQPDKTLQNYMRSNPMKLISDYIKLSKEDKGAPYHFSKEFEKIVQTLSDKVSAILRNKK